jgi:energy-coupling factor transporter ATP-binding protein EcfA2
MNINSFKFLDNKVIISLRDRVCETADELLESPAFRLVLRKYIDQLRQKESALLNIFNDPKNITENDITLLIRTLMELINVRIESVPFIVKGSENIARDPRLLNDFIEHLYNYWRSFERLLICTSQGDALDKRPYRTFNSTIEKLTEVVRSAYRDLQENITGEHPRIYRQVQAGAEIATIALPRPNPHLTGNYAALNQVPVIRQVLMCPPLVINQPNNKRTGKFEKISQNPIAMTDFNPSEWLCYPAKVGSLLILVYINEKFYELGLSLCNLFELADDDMLQQKPDAVYTYGIKEGVLDNLGVFPTVFYDDLDNNMLAAAVPAAKEYGYFGYLKKMVLTLHNIKMMKDGRLPFHGALVKITLRSGKQAVILTIGDTGAGKSETLEAFRLIGSDKIKDITIIADDMGSLDISENGDIIGYGTEIGAFLRLDDLPAGHAFGQMDRSIIMNPNQTNARIILPVTSFDSVIKGENIDFIFYANNYEEIDEDHPVIEKITDPNKALSVFKEGTVMSKGTTTSTGLVHSYFANIFGPPQYRDLHDKIAERYFEAIFAKTVFVGQMRTRLGISGWERKGPEEAAEQLLKLIAEL